jgi:hypothetical protein
MDIFKASDIHLNWDQSNPDGISLPRFKQHVSDIAKNIEPTEDDNGLMYLIHDADDFEEITGVPPVIPVDPGAYPDNANPAAIANHKDLKETSKRHKLAGRVLRQVVIAALPQRIRSMLEQNYSVNHLTLIQMFAQLEEILVVQASDIIWLKDEMSKPWQREIKIETHTARQIQSFGHLESAGQAPAPMEAVALMWKSYTSTAGDHLDFSSCMTHFLLRWPAIDDQTPQHFAASIVLYVNTLLPAERVANNARRKAFAALEVTAGPVSQPVAAAVVATQQQQQQPLRGGPGGQQQRGGQGGRGARGGNGGRGQAAVPVAEPPGRPPYYCFTCGVPAEPYKLHHSAGCKKPAANHNWFATLANQMGGRPA